MSRQSRPSANEKGDTGGCAHIKHLLYGRGEGCVTSHRFDWGPLPPNDVGRFAQQIREIELRNGGKGRRTIGIQVGIGY